MVKSLFKNKNNHKNRNVFMVISIILILTACGALYFWITLSDDSDGNDVEKPMIPITQLLTKTYNQMRSEGILDDLEIINQSISPFENQAVIIEVLRIRHRGLLNRLLTRGNGWKAHPTFYFKTNMDGMEYISKDIEQHGNIAEVMYETWDGMFQETKVVRTVEQEQETSRITLTIVERESTGLLGGKSKDVDKDSFTVTFCHRTGRWTGDDYFGDSDGYGYYLGDTFEIWFNLYRPDFDNDYIPYWTEVNILGTDPTIHDADFDSDGDGIPLRWEWKWGYDPYTWDAHNYLDPDIDSIMNIHEYRLERWFADPFSENIYIEIDHMEQGGIFDPPHAFYDESVQALTERYAQHNIKAFFDIGWHNSPPNGGGQALPHYEMLSQDSGMMLQYYKNYFPDERKGPFIYCLVGHDRGGGFQHPAKGNVYDIIHFGHTPKGSSWATQIKDLLVFGVIPNERCRRVALAGVLLHELGHFGGLTQDYFEGVDMIPPRFLNIFPLGKIYDPLLGQEFLDTWGKYRSVMNYAFMNRPDLLDYSDGDDDSQYDQDDWANFHLGGWSRTSLEVEEAYYLSYGEGWEDKLEQLIDKNISLIEIPPITGYVYDENLTREFENHSNSWSPNSRWNVEWEVHRLVEKEQFPHFRDIKILVSPKDIESKYHRFWSLYIEGDFDDEGNIIFSHSSHI